MTNYYVEKVETKLTMPTERQLKGGLVVKGYEIRSERWYQRLLRWFWRW